MEGKRFPVFFLFTVLVLTPAILTNPPSAEAQEIFVDPSISRPDDFVFSVDIAIDCTGLEVKAAEVRLTFDPGFLQLQEITPGPWFTDIGRDYFFFDYTDVVPQGTIHFASSVLDGTNAASQTLAVCHFSALGFGTSPLVFEEVDVRDNTNTVLGFGHSVGDLILVDPAVPVTDSSFGAVKVLFR